MPGSETVPLSVSAARLLDELSSRIGTRPGVHDWLLALVESERWATAAAKIPVDPVAIGRDIRSRVSRGDRGDPMARDELAERAGRHAAVEDRPVAAAGDVAAVLLAAAGSSTPTRTPAAGAPGRIRARPSSPDVACAPLSIAAARLLASLFAGADPVAPGDLLLALVDQGDALAMADVDPTELDRLVAASSPGGAGPPVSRLQIAGEAGRRAASRRRPVATGGDVAVTVIEAARGAPAAAAPPARATPRGVTAPDEGTGRATPVEPPEAPGQRVIRVFVSSTFRDMKAERDELVKRIFPQLRRLCDERDVTWGEVDLRWGITDEQRAEGRVLPICLAEIHGCRPYFLGLLGERYGWIPESLDPRLLEDHPWLAEHPGASVTELEFLHGALNDPALGAHCFFYLRSPSYIDRLDMEERAQAVEAADPHEVEALGADEAERRVTERRRRLSALKERIRASGLPVRDDYPDPEALGRLVLEDLTNLVDELYPAGSVQHPLDRDAAEHDRFARSRAHVYIGRREYFRQLDEHVAGDGPPLAVLGESGSGKSALLANWALRHQAAHPKDVLITHFIGASPQSGDWMAMVRRVVGELARRFGLTVHVPDDADALRATFAKTLYRAAARGRVVLVLDALNQLEDRQGALELVWLPPELPDGVRVVVSTLPGRPLEEIRRRGWPTVEVQPLERGERARLVAEYLAPRTLSPSRVDRLVDAAQTANPLYLRAVLEELRVWGEHFELDEQIDRYLDTRTIDELYGRILERYEQDYERDRPHLVRDAMSLIWAGRRGLSEAELLDLLGRDGAPLPRAIWSPLALVADQSLVSHSGLITFSHDYLRAAVAGRYLPDDAARVAVRVRIADYFADQPLGHRRTTEEPWQLAQAREWQRLYDLLAGPGYVVAAWTGPGFEVKARWADLEAGSPLRMVDAYRGIVDDPSRYDDEVLWRVERLLAETGHPDEAMSILREEEARARAADSPERLQGILANQGVTLFERGDLDAAMALHREQEAICRRLGETADLVQPLTNQANVLFRQGDLDGAMALHQQVERICRDLGDRDGLQRSLGNQALILLERGDLDGAMACHREEERICRELGDPDELQASLGNQANVLRHRGDLDGALRLLEEKERTCRQLGNRASLARALASRAEVLRDLDRLDGAITANEEALQLARDVDDRLDLALLLGSRAEILEGLGDMDGARACLDERVEVCRGLHDRRGLRRALGDKATLLTNRGDLHGALELHREEERICRELGDADLLSATLNDEAVVLKRLGALDEALTLQQEVERICRDTGDRVGLAGSLVNQGLIASHQGDPERAMALLQDAERTYRELEDMRGLATALADQASVRSRQGLPEEAQALLHAGCDVAREHGLADLVATIEPQLRSDARRGPVAPDVGPVEGLSRPSRLDVVMRNPAGEIVLGIMATGDWSADDRLLVALRAKLDTYVAFAKSEDSVERFGAAPTRILLSTVHEPTPEVQALLRDVTASSGMPIDVAEAPEPPALFR